MMTIVYIILGLLAIGVVFALLKILLEFVAKVIGYIIGLCIVAGVVGLLTYWLLDSFWLGFVPAEIIVLYFYFKNRNAPSSKDDYIDTNALDGTYTSSASYTSSVPTSSYSSYDDDDDDNYREREREREYMEIERERKRENYERYMREAKKAYDNYEYYRSKAEDYKRQADVYRDYAEDKERRGRDYDDESYLREAHSDRESASRCYREAESYLREAESYYREYENAKREANSYQ